uniref:glycosyltransferase family protein n=1 Tax=uncultured Halomonas sp. TaxID=173971 RepID=UPI0026209DC0|nr:glycosyltransferase [uncultured Halomonas sp.]
MDVILHIGAGQGGQLEEWLASGAQRIVLFEPHPGLAKRLTRAWKGKPSVSVVPRAIAAEAGARTLQEYNLPEANSLRAPTALKRLFPGLKHINDYPVQAITPDQMMAEYGPAENASASLVIEAPGEAHAILQPLMENDLLDRFAELSISMTVVPCYQGSVASEQTLEALRDYGFDVVSHDDQDPDWPHWVLQRNPLKVELKKLQHRLSQAEQEKAQAGQYSRQLEQQLAEQQAAKKTLEQEYKTQQQARESEQAKARQEHEGLKKQLAEQQAAKKALEQEYKTQQQARESEQAKAQQEHDGLKKQLAEQQAAKKTLEQEYEKQQQARESEQTKAQQEHDGLKKQLAEQQAAKKALEQEYKTQQQALGKAQEKFQKTHGFFRARKEQALEGEKTIKALRAEHSRLEKANTGLQEELTALKAELSEKSTQSASLDKEEPPRPPGVLSLNSTLALPKKESPQWHSISVLPGQRLVIRAATEHRNIKVAGKRKAVLLFKSFDDQGKELNSPCGSIPRSSVFETHFKYLLDTQGQMRELHVFSVPEGVSEIRLGLAQFNTLPKEQILLKKLSVKPKLDFVEPDKPETATAESVCRLAPQGSLKLPPRAAHPALASTAHQVLYCLHQSVPHATNGYATRSHGIATGLRQAGFNISATTRPGFPWDAGATDLNTPQHSVEVEGITYLAVEGSNLAKTPLDHYLEEAAEHFESQARACSAEVIAAASNHITALPALIAARRLGLPFVYEVRGLWEVTQASNQPAWAESEHYQLMRQLEQQTAREADWVIALTDELADELVSWGVSRERIEVVPNAVNAERFQPMAPDAAIAKELNLQAGVPVIGYAGSAVAYEGLELLVEAMAKLKQSGQAFTFVLVGDGKIIDTVKAKAKELGIEGECRFTGRVPFEQVPRYLSCMDILPIPRLSSAVTEMVSALKPLEAMAMGKAVVLSDVSPHGVMAGVNGERARLFTKDSAESLSDALQALIDNPEERQRLGQAARAWIEQERTWDKVALKYAEGVERVRSERLAMLSAEALSSPLPAREAPAESSSDATSATSSSSQPRLGVLSRPEIIELPQKDPIWYSVSVKPGQALIIEAAAEYRNVKGAQNRKAVLLINGYDADGNRVDTPCGKMAKSGHLKAYFKYLPCTQNQIQELHTFTVPDGISEIRVGMCGFNKKDDEQVMLRELSVKPKPDKSQPTQFVPPSAQAAEISILGWPEQPPNGKPYVIGIMDEFTTGCFEQDVNLIQARPDNWYALAEKYQPEFFFIESAWKGNYGSWQYRVADYANKPGQEVAHICQYAREKGIPTLFWNKEDPVHHQKFMCSAKLVDHIFTTDANMKNSYQAKTGNPNVHALPFAAQPVLHKPAPLAGRKPRACFAGSWYGNRHAERGEAMRWLLQAANRHGLDIFDRNHGTGIFPFPDEYQAGIRGSLPYKALCDEYSRYRVFLNVNSVTDSPTMFSRRVFELMACGTPVVSTYAKGIDNLFNSDAVWLVNSEDEADEALHTLMIDDAEWRRRSLAGIREVFAKHTYAHRLNDIFDHLGIETRLPIDPAVALVAEARSKEELEALDRVARRQSYRHFQLGVACPPGLAQLAGSLSDNITLLEPGQKAAWLAEQQAQCPVAGWLSPRSHYGEHYLRDLTNASLYEPDASGWAKGLDQDVFSYGEQACLAGALWKIQAFLEQPFQAGPDKTLTHPALYLADSDQFKTDTVAQQQTVGVTA